jgi:hypothetical protein
VDLVKVPIPAVGLNVAGEIRDLAGDLAHRPSNDWIH